jgi:hypothetical protein
VDEQGLVLSLHEMQDDHGACEELGCREWRQ